MGVEFNYKMLFKINYNFMEQIAIKKTVQARKMMYERRG